jgi:hypothetical protein
MQKLTYIIEERTASCFREEKQAKHTASKIWYPLPASLHGSMFVPDVQGITILRNVSTRIAEDNAHQSHLRENLESHAQSSCSSWHVGHSLLVKGSIR